MAKNEIAVEESKAVAVATEPLVEIEQSDMMVPFLKVVQSLSEEVVPGKDKYNENVRPGDIYDGVTRTVFKNAKAIVCGLKKYYVEWTPEVRGTLVAKHTADSSVVKNAVKVPKTSDKGADYYTLQTADGNDLIETYGVVMILKNDEGLVMPAVLTLSKTSYIVGKQLTTTLAIQQQRGLPVFRLSTTSSSNTKGSWFKPVFTFDSYESDENIIAMAKGMAPLTNNILFNNNNNETADSPANAVDDLL